MKTVTVEQFLTFNPCYGEERIRRIAERAGKTEFTALDILAIPRIPNVDRLWAVLREELIDVEVTQDVGYSWCISDLNKILKPYIGRAAQKNEGVE